MHAEHRGQIVEQFIVGEGPWIFENALSHINNCGVQNLFEGSFRFNPLRFRVRSPVAIQSLGCFVVDQIADITFVL